MFHIQENSSNFHNDCRFLTILKGKIILTIHERKYLLEKDNIFYIPCDCTYELEAITPSILLYICFHPLFLLDSIGFDYKYISYNSADEHADTVHIFHQQIAALATISLQNSKQNVFLIHSRAYALLDTISKSCLVKPDDTVLVGVKQRAKLQQLYTYVSENYKHPISLLDAATFLGYTPQYLAQFIKKNLQITFADYVHQIRLEAALLFLKYTSESFTRIAGLCGFSNFWTFEKTFLAYYKMKVEDYTVSVSNADISDTLIEITDLSLSLNYIYNYMNYSENISLFSNSTKTEKLSVNVSRITELDFSWNVLINLGKASDFESPSFRQHLVHMQSDISFQYGRFLECLTLSMIHPSEDGVTYNFSKIFEVTDFLLSIHLTPFIDIDNKPFDIYQTDPNAWMDYRSFTDADRYDTFLMEILPPFLNACVARYGFDELCTWKFELWRRYNPEQSSLEPVNTFISRFQQVAAIFKEVDPNLCLGGPGFNSYQDIQHLAQLLTGFQGKAYSPDFISAYYFPFVYTDSVPIQKDVHYRMSSSSNDMADKIREISLLLKATNFDQIPFYITEYTSYLLSNNYINDSAYPATYILSQSIENYGNVNGLGYWIASDLSFDHRNSSSPFFGGNGLFSKDGICKPSYYAFSLLNSLGRFLIAKGENYIVTAREEGRIQTLVYYHSNIVEQQILSDSQGENLLYYPNSAFEAQTPLEFQLTLKQLRSGRYNIKESSLDLNHGNVISIWRQFDFMENIRPTDISYMRQLSRPSIQNRLEDVEGTLVLHTTLNPNEAKLFELELYY